MSLSAARLGQLEDGLGCMRLLGVSENLEYLRVPLKGLEFSKIRGTVFWGPYNMDPTI